LNGERDPAPTSGSRSSLADAPPRVVLEVEELSKSFGPVHAVRGLSLDVRAGEVHAVCGHNGAGKSTLVKTLVGLVRPDEGVIRFEGQELSLRNPQDAQSHGIALVNQELSLVPELSVEDNIYLGGLDVPLVYRRRRLSENARAVLDQLGLRHVQLGTAVEALSIGERQLVEIARLLVRDARLLILDEPTATLSKPEIERVFRATRDLVAQGRSVIFVSHRLDEVFELCDRVTVLRDGRRVATHEIHEIDRRSLIEHMLGDLSQHMHKLARTAAVAERRLVDASKGREKLALARETAGNAIATRIAAAHPKRLLRTLLERAWTDVLALTLMSQGEKSEAYRKQLAVADQLIATSNTIGRNNEPPAAALRREVEKGLSQVGYHKDEIRTVVKRLLTPETANEENPASQTSIALRIKSKAPLTDDERPVHAAALRKAALQLTDVEEKMLETLKHVPFGTWFEFTINQQGERVRRKLSWFSPLTGHCLFVNQRGERARECTLEQLARDIVRDQANIVKPEQESIVDRAWKAIVTSLRQLTGRGADAPPLPA